MEERNRLTEANAKRLPTLCTAMNEAMAELVTQLTPGVSSADVNQLPLLTLGAQFDGSYRNSIGRAATEGVFLAIADLLASRITAKTTTTAMLKNSSGRTVTVELAADPDVAIKEHSGGEARLNIAIEIKGGTDKSNAHNRAGEAEKSHRKVAQEAREFWTIIATKGVDQALLRTESPTTREWFDIGEVLARSGPSWDRFVDLLARGIGVAID